MAKIHYLSELIMGLQTDESAHTMGSGEPPAGPPNDMEARLTAVEQSIVRIDATLPRLASSMDVSEAKGVVLAEIHKGINETQRWMIATVIGLFLGFGGLFLAMSNALKPSAPPLPQQPVIINVPSAAQPVLATPPAPRASH